ncbi:MAG TPA: hypothetical protein VFA48_06180 [Gammaproteobacteria bacterium]|nr:hypothetical protein [Gammaproteobacteria bacterium]
MANHELTITVTPMIPTRMVNALDLEILQALGLTWEKDGESHYYFFSESGLDPMPEMVIDDLQEFLRDAEQEYPQDREHPAWVSRLLGDVETAIEVGADEFIADNDCLPTAEQVLQSVLHKPGWQDRPAYIQMMGASWCSRVRPNEFGGFVTRITPERIVELDTWNGMDRYLRLVDAAQAVVDRWENGDLAAAVRTLAAEVAWVKDD